MISRRSRVRQVVLQLLYQAEINPPAESQWRQFLRRRLGGVPDLVELGTQLYLGVNSKRQEIDQLVANVSKNWRLARMPLIDRNVIRLGAFEFLFFGTPAPVAINEAIELSRRYGTEDSPAFVNGILDKLRLLHHAPVPSEQNK